MKSRFHVSQSLAAETKALPLPPVRKSATNFMSHASQGRNLNWRAAACLERVLRAMGNAKVTKAFANPVYPGVKEAYSGRQVADKKAGKGRAGMHAPALGLA